jgi:hypothetical protein
MRPKGFHHTLETKNKMKGKIPWNKGKKFSIQSRDKMRIAKLKSPVKYWEGKRNFIISGENHPNWKGGISKINKPERQFIMNTLEYKLWRRKVFERDSFTCKNCGEKEKVSGNLQADHIIPWSIDETKRFNIENGQTLCINCHLLKSTYERRFYV